MALGAGYKQRLAHEPARGCAPQVGVAGVGVELEEGLEGGIAFRGVGGANKEMTVGPPHHVRVQGGKLDAAGEQLGDRGCACVDIETKAPQLPGGNTVEVHLAEIAAALQGGEAVVADRVDYHVTVLLKGIGVVKHKAGVGLDHLHGVAIAGNDQNFGGLLGVIANAFCGPLEPQQKRQWPKADWILEKDGVVGGEGKVVDKGKARNGVAVLTEGMALEI